MIYFRSVKWKNFLSTGNVYTEIFLDKSPDTLVVGNNGAGKSTMLDAITFALFGKPFRSINKPQLVNSINDKEAVVEIMFRTQNKEYRVVRGLKPAVFEIWADDVLINQDAKAKDYQEHLEKNILKFNFKAFTQIVILGSSSFIPFMQLSSTDRRTIIEDLLDLQIFSSMNAVVKERLAVLKVEANDLKKNIESTLAQIEMQKKYIEDTKKNTKEQVEKKQAEYDETIEQLGELQRKSDLIQKHVDQLLKKTDKEKEVKAVHRQLSQYEAKIETNMNKITKDIEFFEHSSTCPTCDQSINNKEEKVEQFNAKLNEYKTGLDKLHEEQDKVIEQINELNRINKSIQEHNTEITQLNASITQIQKFASKLTGEIQELTSKRVLSADMRKVSEELLENLGKLEEDRKALVDRKNYIDVAAALLKDTGIKARIIKQYLPIINKLVNKYLASMDFFVNFEIDEEFKESIKSRYRDEFSYQNFSEGEKMRIDLALLFTWRAVAKMKNSMSTNLLILDEVFDSSLDTTGTEEFMKLLHSFGSEANVFVISHKGDILVDKFRSVIRFEKVKNFSQIAR